MKKLTVFCVLVALFACGSPSKIDGDGPETKPRRQDGVVSAGADVAAPAPRGGAAASLEYRESLRVPTPSGTQAAPGPGLTISVGGRAPEPLRAGYKASIRAGEELQRWTWQGKQLLVHVRAGEAYLLRYEALDKRLGLTRRQSAIDSDPDRVRCVTPDDDAIDCEVVAGTSREAADPPDVLCPEKIGETRRCAKFPKVHLSGTRTSPVRITPAKRAGEGEWGDETVSTNESGWFQVPHDELVALVDGDEVVLLSLELGARYELSRDPQGEWRGRVVPQN